MDNKQNIDILFVLYDIGLHIENSAVFQSQVGDQMIALTSFGYSVALLTNYSDREKFEAIAENYENAGIQVFSKSRQGILRDIIGLTKMLRVINSRFNVKKSYVRGLWGPLIITLASPFKKRKFIYDVRGDIKDEYINAKGYSFKLTLYLLFEKFGVKRATRVTAVTNNLAGTISKRHSIYDPIRVIPCCINEQNLDKTNTMILKEYGFKEDQLIFVYSGGLSHYQQIPAMLELWSMFLENERVRFLLLTNQDPHSHPTSVDSIDIFGERLVHLNLPRHQVIPLVSVCDLAFMLREDVPLNNSASPVKFAEYLLSGASIVSSPNIGDASQHIIDNKLGILIDPNDLDVGFQILNRYLNGYSKEMKIQIQKRAKSVLLNNYTWQSHKRIFNELYGSPSYLKN